MTRILAATAGVVGLVVLAGCATSNSSRAQPSTSPALVISPFERLWVAGFVSDGVRSVDVNGETVRLLRAELQRLRTFGVIGGDPLLLGTESVFADSAYWRRMGEEHGSPLIITGSVKLAAAPPNVTQRVGRAGAYVIQPGFFLESRIVLIDGATGAVVRSDRMPRQVRYGAGRRASPLTIYLLMMDSLMPDLLRVVTGQRSARIP